jgi:hypothetical protein
MIRAGRRDAMLPGILSAGGGMIREVIQMYANPKQREAVLIWYAKSYAGSMPYHGKIGKVVIPGKGKPRNHCIDVDGIRVAIPCGNLQKISESPSAKTVCDALGMS